MALSTRYKRLLGIYLRKVIAREILAKGDTWPAGADP